MPSVPAPPRRRPRLSDAEFLRRVDVVIASNLADRGFGTAQLADAFGMSERQMRRRLNAAAGETPGVRLRHARVEAGRALLAGRSRTVTEVARAVGYADDEGFRRAFRRRYGRLPKAPAPGRRAPVPARP